MKLGVGKGLAPGSICRLLRAHAGIILSCSHSASLAPVLSAPVCDLDLSLKSGCRPCFCGWLVVELVGCRRECWVGERRQQVCPACVRGGVEKAGAQSLHKCNMVGDDAGLAVGCSHTTREIHARMHA